MSIFNLFCTLRADLCEGFEEIGDSLDSICTLEGLDKAGFVIQISGNNFSALSLQCLGTITTSVTGEAPDSEVGVLQEGIDNRTTLDAGRADNNDELGG